MKSELFTIPDWFICTCDSSYITMPPRLSDSREDRRIQYEARLNIATISIKRTILAKKSDIIYALSKEIKSFYTSNQLSQELGYHITKKHKQQIQFTVPCSEIIGFENFRDLIHYKLRDYLKTCIKTKWSASVIFEKDTLQALLFTYLKKPEVRLYASIYYTEKYGANATIQLLNTINNDWSIRF